MDETRKRELLSGLVAEFCAERGTRPPLSADAPTEDLFSLFRALANTREPGLPDAAVLDAQDELLRGLIAEAGIHGIDEALLSPVDARLRLWRGDITTLAADAIVNAANSQMLGCWVPGHFCIDNAIHTFAGIQLRAECARLMEEQGFEEPTGRAKVTPAYNLPARFIIHTVGPIANGRPSAQHCRQLALCYESCLGAADELGVQSLAFCCISTGVFGFPQRQAAEIAQTAVRAWLDAHPQTSLSCVIFNVFGEADEAIYRDLLGLA